MLHYGMMILKKRFRNRIKCYRLFPLIAVIVLLEATGRLGSALPGGNVLMGGFIWNGDGVNM